MALYLLAISEPMAREDLQLYVEYEQYPVFGSPDKHRTIK